MICRARKTLPCHRNHFTLSSWPPTSAARSGGGAAGRSGSGGGEHRLLAMLVITVIRMVMWNQSSRCSACGFNIRDLPRMLNPQAEHLLDWFHITMRITVMTNMAKSLCSPPPDPDLPAAPPPDLAADVGGQVGWWRGRQVGVGWWGAQALGHVGHHGDPHGDVEPVEQVLGLRVQHPRQVADVLAAVGAERDLLIRRQAVTGEHLEQPPLGLGVVGLHEPETGGVPVRLHGLAGDHLEPAIAPRPLGGGADVAAVQAHDQRQVRSCLLYTSDAADE